MSTEKQNLDLNIVSRVWLSPRTDMGDYPWNWAVQNNGETLEFGRERNESDAKREASEAYADWHRIIWQNL